MDKLFRGDEKGLSPREFLSGDQVELQVNAVFGLLSDIYGSDRLVLRAGKLEALHLMRSEDIGERVLALERIIYEDPTIDEVPRYEEIPRVLDELQDEIAEILARRTVEEQIEKKIAEKMQDRHEEYIREIRMQVLKEDGGPDNAQTLKKYAELELLEEKGLTKSAIEAFRPQTIGEVVGQDRAVQALLSKIASPYPQHILVYGPPGVGKTTVARLALEVAKELKFTPFAGDASFVEVDGTVLRWDPREVTNPLLGSVHDPIYQGARRDLAESGVPEPKPGLVTEAHGGILFIDEIGEMDLMLQNKLLKVLEDKRVYFESSYYDPDAPDVPKYIKKLFEEGAPADFLLIGATTREPHEINPALRSRCAEVFFEPLTPLDIQKIVVEAAERIGVKLEEGLAELISDYTIEGRQATRILADAYGGALYRLTSQGQEEPTEVEVTKADLLEVIHSSRLTPYVTTKASEGAEVGRIFGLGVSGYLGSVLELEAVAFPAQEKGKGHLRFNETAGSMAKDSVFNATSVLRRLTGKEVRDYDIHVNVVGGGRIDGPSAGAAILICLISAIENWPIYQNVAMTGEISIQGKVKPIGGVYEKIYGAKQAGITKVLIPIENAADIPENLRGIEIVPVATVDEALPHFFGENVAKNLKMDLVG